MSEIFMTTHCYIRYALEIPSYINMKITVPLQKVLIVSRETVVWIMNQIMEQSNMSKINSDTVSK